MKCSIHAITVSKLNESKYILSIFVWVLACPLDSGIQDNSTFVGDLKELLKILQVNVVNRMNPDSSFKSSRVQIFQFL